jgi:hypothetical protein
MSLSALPDHQLYKQTNMRELMYVVLSTNQLGFVQPTKKLLVTNSCNSLCPYRPYVRVYGPYDPDLSEN